jgi:lipid-binding SYLF domain-containing protein
MKLKMKLIAGLAALLLFSGAWAEATPEECTAATENFSSLSTDVKDLLAQSYGYVVLPTIGKGGLGIGGAGGSGCVYAGGKQTGTVKMGQITIGLQAGGQAFSQIILIENQETFDKFTSGEFQFGAQASAVALTAAAQAEAGTKGSAASFGTSEEESGGKAAGFKNGMAVFTVAKGGLMIEASIGGQKFDYESL